jgi:conjugative transfer signal peptidase TraF
MKSRGEGLSFARASRVIAVCGVSVLCVVLLLYACGARINRTNSLPKGIYWVVDKPPERGDIVLFWPSDCAEMRMARERGYIYEGVFNAASGIGYGLLMKRFLGLPGDVVSVTDAGIIIKGTLVPNTKPLHCDNIGDPLPHLRFLDYTLKENEAFFVSDHLPRSFDARYFGVQGINQIVDVVVPVYVW